MLAIFEDAGAPNTSCPVHQARLVSRGLSLHNLTGHSEHRGLPISRPFSYPRRCQTFHLQRRTAHHDASAQEERW